MTEVLSVMSFVEAAAALITDVGDESGIVAMWCSPTPKTSRHTSSASRIDSSTSRMACAVEPRPPSAVQGGDARPPW